GPYADLRDREGFLESARRARLLGFDGKWCLHPDQIAWAEEAFSPTAQEIAEAERVLSAHAEATAEGRGAVALGAAMVDEASRKMAEQVLARARRPQS